MNKREPARQARVIYARSTLTLDLPAACDPIIWRQQIKNIASIAFALHQLPDSNIALVLRMPDAAEQIIATFDSLPAAEDTLAALRTILVRPRRKSILLNVLKWLVILGLFWLALHVGIQVGLNSQSAHAVPVAPQTLAPSQPDIAAPPTQAPIQPQQTPVPVPAGGQ